MCVSGTHRYIGLCTTHPFTNSISVILTKVKIFLGASTANCSKAISSQVRFVVVFNFEDRRPSSSWKLCCACSGTALTCRRRRRLGRRVLDRRGDQCMDIEDA